MAGMRHLLVAAALLAAACGGKSWRDYADRCAVPRTTGADPNTGQPWPDQKGTIDDEKTFLKLWINDVYLWYREVPDLNPKDFATPLDFFAALKTPLKTPGGRPKDPPQFHFTYPTDYWNNVVQSGTSGGYGATFSETSLPPQRVFTVAYVLPNTPAAAAGLDRGATITQVDGTVVLTGDINAIVAGLISPNVGETHTFKVVDRGSTTERSISMTAVVFTETPVLNVETLDTPTGKVGYFTFTDHIFPAEKLLIDAVNQLKTAGIADLVIDLRYNGGGSLGIAQELASMVAGAGPVGRTFEKISFNDKYPTSDPIFGDPIQPVPFVVTARGFSVAAGTPLPGLNLTRLYVLTSSNTCSASESIINGLRGIDVQVFAFGNNTCGKPYGFFPQDNCATTYFAIEFKGVNQKGFGDYPDGFVVGGTGDTGLPGCAVADDFNHALGDPAEARLAAALAFRQNGTCPAGMRRADAPPVLDGRVYKSVWRENRWYR